MNSRTKQIFIIACLALIATFAVCALLMVQIRTQGTELETFITALAEKNAEEASYIRVSRLVQETESERTVLNRAFFTDESDSISFLGSIESFAASVGLELTTEGLDKIEEGGSEFITMTFLYTGEKSQVLHFTKYLENIPYHSSIRSHIFTKNGNGEWEGNLTLLISLKKPS